MKKTVVILISILIAVYFLLVIISANDEYAADKLFYQAMRVNEKIILNPDVAPPGMLSDVETPLQMILMRYPECDVAKDAHLSLAEFYLVHKKYNQAIAASSAIVDKYAKDEIILTTKGHFIKGSAYEKQDKWQKALAEYTILRDKYPNTPLGVSIPLYIGEYYKRDKKYAQSERAYNEAALCYEMFLRKNEDEKLGYMAVNFLMADYVELKQWEEAARVLEKAIDDYPRPHMLVQQLPKIELIFIKKLNKYDEAIGLYTKINTQIKDPKVTAFIDEKIKDLEAQKQPLN